MDHKKHKEHKNHSKHIQEFRTKFFVSLILTVPILALSQTIQAWLNFTLDVPFQKEIVFLFSLLIYVYGGSPFLRGMFQEIKKRQPGMMTLIGTAISVAFYF